MKLITREQLGWPPTESPLQATTDGVKIHYEGTPVSTDLLTDHDACLREWQAIRASHLANKKENFSDVAYNYAACPHGFLMEGRGIGHRTGANGNQPLNRAHYAIVGLVGDQGLTDPTKEMLNALRDGVELLQQNGAGPDIKGHQDGFATDCPGEPLETWVRAGAPRPNGGTPVIGQAGGLEPFPGAAFFHIGQHSDIVTRMGVRLVEEGCSRYKVGPGPDFGPADQASYAAFQQKLGFSGADADGIPGPTSWAQLRVPTG
ncbi:peptidoglycan-binding protein [Kitasatospora sp. NPDC049285]|uniref:peptidoglycan-binding protein n=1 Tax=Kitasatospora sp. NPDC049285 TaxID=3157096 RepID=UPI0034155A6F